MKVFDLTHTITNDMTIFPGGEPPKYRVSSNIKENCFKETEIHMHSHNGTHMDSPAHVFEDGTSLDNIDVINFIGRAALIDCTCVGENNLITYDLIEKNKEIIENAQFLVFQTNWSKYWNTEKYLNNYPVLGEEVIDYIIASKKKGIAFDTISLDPIDSPDLAKHHRILGNNILIFENLTNLDLIESKSFIFCALPLKFKDSDGAPIRAIAMVD